MLEASQIRQYLLTLNAIVYKYDDEEFARRCDFVCKMGRHYGYLSYSHIVDMFENQ